MNNLSHLCYRMTRASIIMILFMMVLSSQAMAHAVLQGTQPVNGSLQAEFPDLMFLRFSEPVAPIRLQLLDGSGMPVELAAIQAVNNELHFSPRTPQGDGQYILSYRVMSQDAHPIGGSIAFAVGDAQVPELSSVDNSNPVSLFLFRINRAIYLVAVLSSIGLVLFPLLFIFPAGTESMQRISLMISTGIGIATGMIGMGLWGLLLADVPPTYILRSEIWALADSSSLSVSTALATLGLVLIMMSSWADFRLPGKLLAIAGVLVTASSFSMSGHAAATDPWWFFAPIFALHVLMAAIWFGALVLLYYLARRESSSDTTTIFQQFSRRVTVLVVLLLLCAAVISWYQIGTLDNLFGTDYGRWLLIKLGLVMTVLLLAAANRWYFVPALAGQGMTGQRRLRKAVCIETLLVIVVLAVTTVLASTPMPTRNVADASKTITLTGYGEISLVFIIEPGQVGDNSVSMAFAHGGHNIEPMEVVLRWSMEQAGIEPLMQQAILTEGGTYRIENVGLLIEGAWQFRVEALIDDFTRNRYEFSMDMTP